MTEVFQLFLQFSVKSNYFFVNTLGGWWNRIGAEQIQQLH